MISKPKGLILRVGIDTGCGGMLSPLFKDGNFEFIPIPEKKKVKADIPIYSQLSAKTASSMTAYVLPRLHNEQAHVDPEFKTFTYGDPTKNKRRQLSRLEKGDYLIFYAGLAPYPDKKKGLLYLVGYFEVDYVLVFEEIDNMPLKTYFDICNNAHMKRGYLDKDLVIVRGHQKRSRLLKKAVQIGNKHHRLLPTFEKKFGFAGGIMRASGRWIDPKKMQILKKWLEKQP